MSGLLLLIAFLFLLKIFDKIKKEMIEKQNKEEEAWRKVIEALDDIVIKSSKLAEILERNINKEPKQPVSSFLKTGKWICPSCGNTNLLTTKLCSKWGKAAFAKKPLDLTNSMLKEFCPECKHYRTVGTLFFKNEHLYATLECFHVIKVL
jgi:rubrerythrin